MTNTVDIRDDHGFIEQGVGANEIRDRWEGKSLAEIIDIRHGFAFKSAHFRKEPCDDILLTPGNFAVGGGFKSDKLKYYSGPIPEEYMLNAGDLVITMTDLSKNSDTLGYPAIVPRGSGKNRFLHNQRIGKVIVKDEMAVDRRFLFYLMCSKPYRDEILASATGTTVKHTSPDRIRRFSFKMPPLSEQRHIAHVLGTLDDKIELNRRMNATLETMARALFRSWFVDFEPVRAKTEGRWLRGESLPGVPAELYELFPERLVPSELGEVPEGWDVGVLDDAIELLSGGTPKTSVSEYWNGTIPWYTAKDAPSPADVFVVDTERKITQAGIDNSSTRMLPEGTTIITARGTVGRLACLGIPMTMNQTCYGIRGEKGYPDYFTYWNIRMTVAELQRRTHGTIFDTITRQTFKFVDALLPPVSLATKFENVVQPTMDRSLRNLHEIRSLVDLRNSLLPSLMSGNSQPKQ